MTDQYAVLRAGPSPEQAIPEVVGFQSKHSILRKPWFLSPWQAIENAADLAFGLNPSSFIGYGSSVDFDAIWLRPSMSSRCRVHFDDQHRWQGGFHRIDSFTHSRLWHLEAFCSLNSEWPEEALMTKFMELMPDLLLIFLAFHDTILRASKCTNST